MKTIEEIKAELVELNRLCSSLKSNADYLANQSKLNESADLLNHAEYVMSKIEALNWVLSND